MAKAVVDGLPQVSEKLLRLFDAAYAARPSGEGSVEHCEAPQMPSDVVEVIAALQKVLAED
jgi:hypothetical protein